MPKMMTVGMSNRTHGKHEALRKFLGKQAGASIKRFADRRSVYIDCTAGNGIAEKFDRDTSPGLLIKTAAWQQKNGVLADVHLFEREEREYISLTGVVAHYMQQIDQNLSCTINCRSSLELERCWGENDLLFVVNDPNSVDGLKFPSALRDAPPLTTIFSTIGANAGGVKRLPIDRREQWYKSVEDQSSLLQTHHDMYLVKLDKDASQWAYAINTPKKWCDDIEEIFRSAFAYGWTVTGAWYKRDYRQFVSLVDRLFLRRDEL